MNTLVVVKKEAAKKRILVSGDSYAIPGNTPHSFQVLNAAEVIDVFTPHREDYL